MTTRTSVTLVSILLLCTPLLGALAHGPSNDAGSGGDAPDDPDLALNLTPGAYIGNLTPGSYEDDLDEYESYEDEDITKDKDWYRVDTDEDALLACTEATFEPDEKPHNDTRVRLTQPDLDRAWINATATGVGETLAMVGPDATGAILGLETLDPPRVTEYGLDIDVLTLSEVGGGSQEGAVPGPCFGDTIDDGETHSWTFEVEEGQFLFLSLGTELERLDELSLTAPNGTMAGSIVSGEDIALGAKTLNHTGTWELSLQADSTGLLPSLTTTMSDYLVGFSLIDGPDDDDDDNDQSPCRPHCMSLE